MNLRRISALIVKEFRQLIRDPLSIGLGILLPAVLLLICGYGMSTDIRNIKMVLVIPETSEEANQIGPISFQWILSLGGGSLNGGGGADASSA
ncbi:MAG: hypothetical protein Q4D17_06505 [Planctomycetia bacterium]|nr:hypothetical protein [Planctomycetia bacterium]